ncbi:MAG TPA: DUF488 domain-containing protein [Anaerolineales bacterium]|nr:DUF488 domain-containing protein [Anaerolineales bacterium]
MTIQIKRAYEPPSSSDGTRILVDRLWPRGISKEKLKLDEWMKEVSPSNELRKEFHHDASRWQEFQKRYAVELDRQPDLIAELRKKARRGKVTLVYAAQDEVHNNAAALKKYLEKSRK